MQSPRALIVPAQATAEEVDAVVLDDEAEPAEEDLDDETVMVERVEAGAAVLLLDAGAVTVM
jgi:short subunit fatty acids transporter